MEIMCQLMQVNRSMHVSSTNRPGLVGSERFVGKNEAAGAADARLCHTRCV
jgi:hypothetical protein